MTSFLILFWKVIHSYYDIVYYSEKCFIVYYDIVYYSEKCFIVTMNHFSELVWEKWSQCPFWLFSQFGRVPKCDKWWGWPNICRLTTRIEWQISSLAKLVWRSYHTLYLTFLSIGQSNVNKPKSMFPPQRTSSAVHLKIIDCKQKKVFYS